MKLTFKDGKGRRVVTEVKRPDPAAVLVLEEEKEYDIEIGELFIVVDLGYVKTSDMIVDTKKVINVYPDAIKFDEEEFKARKPLVQTPPKKA